MKDPSLLNTWGQVSENLVKKVFGSSIHVSNVKDSLSYQIDDHPLLRNLKCKSNAETT